MAIGAIAEAVAGLAEGAYNAYASYQDRQWARQTSQRDFDYQKALQQQIFEREDNAVQRRRADLEAAGMNPNLAAGSAASAGAVVGRSNTPGLPSAGNPVGTALDTASAVAQLRAQREQNQILKNQEKESAAKAKLANNEALLDNINLNSMLGLKTHLTWNEKEKAFQADWSGNFNRQLTRENSPIMNYLYWQYQNNKNSADMLQKDVDFYTADKIANYLGVGASIFSGAGSGALNFRKFSRYK